VKLVRTNTFIIVLISLLFSMKVFSHARIKSDALTPPRNNNPGLKTGPCGGIARTNTPKVLSGGDTIELKWEETIQHPGRYEFSISLANDQSFIQLLIVPDVQDNTNDLPHQYSALLTVPNINCTDCTLQMIQVMTENPANPRNYYSCADIQIVSSITPTPTPTPVVTPTPTPVITPTPTPVVTPTPTPVITPTPTPVVTPTPTPVITPTPTPVITPTQTPIATPMPTPIPTTNPDPPNINSPNPDETCVTR
jgi:hypothetical protein